MSGIKNKTLQSAGIIGNNIPVNSSMCSITDPGIGRYEVYGYVRHTLEDGCKLLVGPTLVLFRIPQQAGALAPFGPLVVDTATPTEDIQLQLAVATGAADTASGVIYARRLDTE